ncbi:MAG: hypothetical protein ACJ72D_27460 [Marmoricola sp.]
MTPAQNSTPENDLTLTLARQADRYVERGGHDLDLDGVLARAGEIRRGRRMRASMVMAAVAVAVAVPLGITVLGDDGTSSPNPPVATRSPSPKGDDSPISLDGLGTGKAPRTGYFLRDTWTSPDGTLKDDGPDSFGPTDVAVLDGGLLVVHSINGNRTVSFIDASTGKSDNSWPIGDGGLAVSPGGNVGAFVQPDGTPVVVQDAGSRYYELPRIPISDVGGDVTQIVSVVGENCSGRGEGASCTVFVNQDGETQRVWTSTTHGTAQQVDAGFKAVTAVDPTTGYTSGITDYKEDLSTCSATQRGATALKPPSGANLWETCDYRLLQFSPDGKYLLASGSTASGNGDSSLAVLDAVTGKVVLDLHTAENAVVVNAIWEDGTHLLANVLDSGRAAIVRISTDGTRQLAVAPVTPEDSTISPFHLPVLASED